MSSLVAALAPGMRSARPTGSAAASLRSYPDNRAVNALIGVDAKDGGVQVDRDARPRSDPEADFCGGYSWCIRVNPDGDLEGTTDPSAVKVWGTGGAGCASAKIDLVFIEIYRQVQHAPGQFRTDFTRYGARPPTTTNRSPPAGTTRWTCGSLYAMNRVATPAM